MHSAPLLVVLVCAPAAAALALGLWPRLSGALAVAVGTAVGVVEFALVLVLASATTPNGAVYQDAATQTLAAPFGLVWRSGVDGISLLLVLLTALLVPLAIVGAPERLRTRAAVAWLLLLESATIGAFVSLDVLLFFLFFELTLVPAYFLIARWGDQRPRAGRGDEVLRVHARGLGLPVRRDPRARASCTAPRQAARSRSR